MAARKDEQIFLRQRNANVQNGVCQNKVSVKNPPTFSGSTPDAEQQLKTQ